MAYLRKKGRQYYAEFYDPQRSPSRKWLTLRTADRQTAQVRMVELERAYARGERDPWTDGVHRDGILLTDAVNEYLESRSDRREKTRRADRSLLGLLVTTLPPGTQLRQVEARHLAKLVQREGLSDATKATYLTRLRTFFKWCKTEKLLRDSPASALRSPKKGRAVAMFLTREQYHRLRRCIQANATLSAGRLKEGEVIWLLDVVSVAVGTGMRLSEICHMRWSWVNLETGFITVKSTPGFRTKSGHERAIYVTGDARDVLKRLSDARTSENDGYVFLNRRGQNGDTEKLNATYVSKRFLHYARMASLAGIHFHTLRHTYASWLVMAGVDVFRVKELLGHADIGTTMRYAHLAPKAFRYDVERVFGKDTDAIVGEPLSAFAA